MFCKKGRVNMNKTITLLGSTGSIGTQSLDVARMQIGRAHV